jgi:hypothetical protein
MRATVSRVHDAVAPRNASRPLARVSVQDAIWSFDGAWLWVSNHHEDCADDLGISKPWHAPHLNHLIRRDATHQYRIPEARALRR